MPSQQCVGQRIEGPQANKGNDHDAELWEQRRVWGNELRHERHEKSN